jgi:hypothetical protein
MGPASSFRSYQRQFMRVPYNVCVLGCSGEEIFKAQSLNLSEGGILLSHVSLVPTEALSTLIVPLKIWPLFKNMTVGELSAEVQGKQSLKIVSLKAALKRSQQKASLAQILFEEQLAYEFDLSTLREQTFLKKTIDSVMANITYLQMLIDSWRDDPMIKQRVSLCAEILGYAKTEKIAELRHKVMKDYQSMVW